MQHPHKNKIEWDDPDEEQPEDEAEEQDIPGTVGDVDPEGDWWGSTLSDEARTELKRQSEEAQYDPEKHAARKLSDRVQKQQQLGAYLEQKKELQDLVDDTGHPVPLPYRLEQAGWVKEKVEGEKRPKGVKKVAKSEMSETTAKSREWEQDEPEHGEHYVWTNPKLRDEEGNPTFEIVQGYATKGQDGEYTFYVKHPLPTDQVKPRKPILPQRPGGYAVEDMYKWSKPRAGGPSEEISPTTSWGRTHQFNKEQRKRAREAVKQGDYYRGYSLWEGKRGVEPKLVPQEKSDIGIGANKEYVIHTGVWERTDLDNVIPKKVDRYGRVVSPQKDPYVNSSITVRLQNKAEALNEAEQKDRGVGDIMLNAKGLPITNEDGIPIRTAPVINPGQNLQSVVERAGLKNIADIEQDKDDPNVYKIVSSTGTHITPGQAASVRKALRESPYGISRKKSGEEVFQVNAPPMREKVARVPYAASKAGIPESEIEDAFTEIQTPYQKTLNTHIGRRDSKGELLKNEKGDTIEKDTLAIRAPGGRLGEWAYGDRVGYMHFRDRTDAIGWGKDWRPGEAEVSSTVMLPAREKDKAVLNEALKSHQAGDSSRLDAYIREKDPDIDESSLEKTRTELGAVAGAAGASLYYTAHRKTGKSFKQGAAYKSIGLAHKVPGVAAFDERHSLTQKFMTTHETAGIYKLRAGEKYTLAKTRLAHPLTAMHTEHINGESRVVGESAGIGMRNIYPSMPGGFRYRDVAINPHKKRVRAVERERIHLEGQVKARTKIKEDVFAEPTRNPIRKLDRRFSLRAAQTIIDSDQPKEGRATGPLEERVGKLRGVAREARETRLADNRGPVRSLLDYHLITPYHNYETKLHEEGERSAASVKSMKKELREAKFTPEQEEFIKAKNLKSLNKPMIPAKAKLGIGAAVLVGGASIYAYDKHKEYQTEKGKEPTHPLTKHLPETIHTPSARARVTHEYHIPDNAFTNALDLENKKAPVGWKVSVGAKEHRIRNRKDISGETYKSGPIVGNIGIRAPAKNTGSLVEGIAYERPSAGPGAKNQYGDPRPPTIKVAGHNTGVTLDLGNKERWQDRQHKKKLKTSVKSLDKDEREHMKKRRERLEKEMKRATDIENERLAARVGVGAGLSSRTVEDYEAEHLPHVRAQREYKRSHPDEFQ